MKIRVVLVQKNGSLRSDNDSIGIKDDENPLAVTIRMCSRYARDSTSLTERSSDGP